MLPDPHHPGRDCLSISLEIKRGPDAPAVMLYSGATDDATVVAATPAGASAVVNKSRSTVDLLETIRTVAADPRPLPRVSLRMRREAAARLAPVDRPILAMRLAGYPPGEIGETTDGSNRASASDPGRPALVTREAPITGIR